MAQVASLQADIASCEAEQEVIEKLFTDEILIPKVIHEVIAFEKDEVLEEQATEIIMEPVASLAPKTEKVIVLEGKSQIKDNAEENAAICFEQVASVDSADCAYIKKIKQMGDETNSVKCVAVSNVETMALDAELLEPKEMFAAKEQQVATNEINGEPVGDDKVKEVGVVLTKEDILQESVMKLYEAS